MNNNIQLFAKTWATEIITFFLFQNGSNNHLHLASFKLGHFGPANEYELDASSAWSLYKCKMFNCLYPTSLLTLCFLFLFFIFIIFIFKFDTWSFLFLHDSLMWYLIIRTVFGFNTRESFKIQITEKLPNHFLKLCILCLKYFNFILIW